MTYDVFHDVVPMSMVHVMLNLTMDDTRVLRVTGLNGTYYQPMLPTVGLVRTLRKVAEQTTSRVRNVEFAGMDTGWLVYLQTASTLLVACLVVVGWCVDQMGQRPRCTSSKFIYWVLPSFGVAVFLWSTLLTRVLLANRSREVASWQGAAGVWPGSGFLRCPITEVNLFSSCTIVLPLHVDIARMGFYMAQTIKSPAGPLQAVGITSVICCSLLGLLVLVRRYHNQEHVGYHRILMDLEMNEAEPRNSSSDEDEASETDVETDENPTSRQRRQYHRPRRPRRDVPPRSPRLTKMPPVPEGATLSTGETLSL